MAPDVKSQTKSLVICLLADDGEIEPRMFVSDVETDSAVEDTFDPVILADKLRTIADALNEDIRFKAAMKDLGKNVADEAFEATFSLGVETLCESYVTSAPEVAPEMQLIKASVAFGLYVKKNSPHLKTAVCEAMTSFLNRRVGTWVTQQGGWDKVPVSN